jgi:hypothetical protein
MCEKGQQIYQQIFFVVQIKRDYEGQQGKELLSAQHHQLLNWLKNAETPCEI